MRKHKGYLHHTDGSRLLPAVLWSYKKAGCGFGAPADRKFIPEQEELRMAQYMDKKGRLQVAKGINSKDKRSLFIN